MSHRARTILVASPLLLALAGETAPAIAQPADIRGLRLDRGFSVTEILQGMVNGSPVQTNVAASLYPTRHTFEIAADPAAPNDVRRAVLRTRLSAADSPPMDGVLDCPIVALELPATYDPATGAFRATGNMPPSVVHHVGGGPDPFGIFPFDTYRFLLISGGTLTLTGIASTDASGRVSITGLDTAIGNLTAASVSLAFTPSGVCDPAQALLTLPVADPLGGVLNWTASQGCMADIGSIGNNEGPDGGVTIDDLLMFLANYDAGAAIADLDDGSGAGRPDGGVTVEDLSYFLMRLAAGC
jgi:hypothetical protein